MISLPSQCWPRINEPYSGHPTADENQLQRYCHQVIDALETSKFTYIAHPDLINFVGDVTIYRRQIHDLCRAAKEMDIPLEINLLGMAYNKHYPNERFWEVAAEEGCKAILGLDAHALAHIMNMEMEQRALEMVQRLGLELLETVNLRSI